uniref:NADPH oxidase organizer 1 n=1 Tax=Athene cunicularia TaxID=194338 RepID=A0A663LL37_ATHCN
MPSEIGGEKKNPAQQKLSSITHPQVSQSYRCIETFETKDTKNKTFKVDKKEIIEVLIKDMTGMFDRDFLVSERDGVRLIHSLANAKSGAPWLRVSVCACAVLTRNDTGGRKKSISMALARLCRMSLLFLVDYGCLSTCRLLKTFFWLFAAGWWLVENADKQIAWFPASYLEEIDVHKDIQSALSSDKEGSLYFVARAYESQKADELSLNNGGFSEGDSSLLQVHPACSGRGGDRNDSGFVESSTADLNYSLTDPDLAACAPKVPVRPSAHEILQKCSTITKRAVQQSSSRPALQALLPLPSTH